MNEKVHKIKLLYQMKHNYITLIFTFLVIFCQPKLIFPNPLLLKEIERIEFLLEILELKNKNSFMEENLQKPIKDLEIAKERFFKKRFGLSLKKTLEAKNSTFNILDESYGYGTSKVIQDLHQTENFFFKIRPEIRKEQNFESVNTFILANEKLDSARIELGNLRFQKVKDLTQEANHLARTAFRIAKIEKSDFSENETFNFIKTTDNFLRKAHKAISKEHFQTANDLQSDAWQKFSQKDFKKAIELSKSVRTILKSNFDEEVVQENLTPEFVRSLLQIAKRRIELFKENVKLTPSRRKKRLLNKIQKHFDKAENEFERGNLRKAVLELKICKNLKSKFQENSN